ncbi:hypothetical protein B0H65DRAFT_147511 [Neurospora tetraspora]|uniref:Secreted protein n=1 Tax=Neurospora tetraspora TaxID=94610 RepID=A0AAE0JH25_9PEZI|nr:hypothetical protein B0H65DRAFT_147511 [Neurospora tetraspora]
MTLMSLLVTNLSTFSAGVVAPCGVKRSILRPQSFSVPDNHRPAQQQHSTCRVHYIHTCCNLQRPSQSHGKPARYHTWNPERLMSCISKRRSKSDRVESSWLWILRSLFSCWHRHVLGGDM